MNRTPGAVSTEVTVQKHRSRLGIGIGLATVAAAAALVLLGGDDRATRPLALAEQDANQTTGTAVSWPEPTTVPTTEAPETTSTSAATPGWLVFREILVETLVDSCDPLIEGPAPVPTELRARHSVCVTEALLLLEHPCLVAAAVLFAVPDEEAIRSECDLHPDLDLEALPRR